MKSFSIREAVSYGWETFKKRPWFFISIQLIAFTVSLLAQAYSTERPVGDALIKSVLIVITAVFSIIQIILSINMQYLYLQVESGAPVSYRDLFIHRGVFFKYLFGWILYLLIVTVGLMFFIVPGVILAVMYGFFYVLIVDKKYGPVQSLKESARLTKGVRIHLFLFGLVLGVLHVVGLIPLGLGLLITVPIIQLAIVHVYRELSRRLALETSITQ